MALQTINVGNFVNDGTGDDLRTAFVKINENFDELDLRGGQANTISNVGIGIGIFKEKVGVDLRLKTLVAGPGISLSASNNEITISNNRNAIVTIVGDSGTLTASSGTQAINIVGAGGTTTSISGNTVTIAGGGDLVTESNPTLSATLDINNNNLINGNEITAIDFYGRFNGPSIGTHTGNVSGNLIGNVTGLVYGIDIRDLDNKVNGFDFGSLDNIAESFLEYLALSISIDGGTMLSPTPIIIENGVLV